VSTTSFQSAENALTNEITRMQGIIDARDVLREIGTLRQAADESAKRLEAALAAEKEAQAELDDIQQRVAAARTAADIDIAKASAAGDTELTKARVAAAAIVEKARIDAAQIVSDAKSQTADSVRRAAVLAEAIKQAGT
jgi:hypothetical protein